MYEQLNLQERILIDYLLNVEKRNFAYISKKLSRSWSTISREIKRNTHDGVYLVNTAENRSKKRKLNKYFFYLFKYQKFSSLFARYYNNLVHGVKETFFKIMTIHQKIKIACWRQVYYWIKSNRWIIKARDRLRRAYWKPAKRKIGIFAKFKGKMVFPIWIKPKSIDKRLEYGRWEADLIIGWRAGFDNLLMLVERSTCEVYIARIKTKNPYKCNSVILKLAKKFNLSIKSITIDNGFEFGKIGLLANWLKWVIYFCEPYASYQRGSNEHINDIIRRFCKKGKNFSLISDDEINNMPREMFAWKSSY